MNSGALFTLEEPVCNDLFPIAVREKVDGTRGDNSNESWSKTAKKSQATFNSPYISVRKPLELETKLYRVSSTDLII